MPNKKYMSAYGGYWPKASQCIYELIKKNIIVTDEICEAGCASGHIMANLIADGYHVTGYEIRNDECIKTRRKFKEMEICGNIIHKDIMDVDSRYDVLYTTGLLQCFKDSEREEVIRKFSEIAEKIIIVVPDIKCDRCYDSGQKTGVAGCAEYEVSHLKEQLKLYFEEVENGFFNAASMELKDDFLWFICKNRCLK